jgi:hypothetical protein
MSPRDWSPEARAAFGAKMKAISAAKKSNGKPTPAPTPSPLDLDAAAPVLNPISTDIVKHPPPERRAGHSKLVVKDHKIVAEKTFSVSDIIARLESIPLGDVAYADCGLLLNALNVASTAVALARRQKQEGLEAGSHRAPCKTCGRMIDISKSGGFQILTERDQFHMPQNSYYCSQNCLLARNMPSHARQTYREKKENQA